MTRSALRLSPVLAGVLLLAGCSPATDSDEAASLESFSVEQVVPASSTSPAPEATIPTSSTVSVHCGVDLAITVSSAVVAATSAGVVLEVSSDAPAGTYLTFGNRGEPLPEGPETWVSDAPPGEMALTCMLDGEESEATVTVVDPDGVWSDRTLAEAGCTVSGIPGWAVAVAGAKGDTAEEAVEDLLDKFTSADVEPVYTRSERADIGYPESPEQTWIIGTDRSPHVTAVVIETADGFAAHPDVLCERNGWPEIGD